MARDENMPFKLGETYFGSATPDTTVGVHLEGKTYVVESHDYSVGGGSVPQLTGRYKKVMIVRNSAAATLLPKRIAKMTVAGTANEFLGQTSGYATTVGELGYPIDEFLPSTGVVANDLFYVVVEGIAKVTTGSATAIAIADMVIPTTGGKVIGQNTGVAAGAATFAQVQGAIGRAVVAIAIDDTGFYINVTAK